MGHFNRSRVVMSSPVDEKGSLILNSFKDTLKSEGDFEFLTKHGWKYYDIYIISNEKPQKNDWCYDELNDKVYLATDVVINNSTTLEYPYLKKIISSSAKLVFTEYMGNSTLVKDQYYLPQLPDSFIKRYVDVFNKGDIIISAMVEYEDIFTSNQGLGHNESVTCRVIKIDGDNVYGEYVSSVSVHKDQIDLNTPFSLSTLKYEGNKLGVKINPHYNTINIIEMKDDWDIIEMCEFADWCRVYDKKYPNGSISVQELFSKWYSEKNNSK